jgi:hypothetical protein
MDSTILVLGEMTGGMLLACVPTLGPLFFSDRDHRALQEHHIPRSIETIGSRSRKRKVLRPSFVDSLFSSKAETQIEVDEHGEELPLRREGMTNQQLSVPNTDTY